MTTNTATTNEAAERLRIATTGMVHPDASALLQEALAAERRATVERIRKGLLPRGGRAYYSEPWQRMLADRLDDEAAR